MLGASQSVNVVLFQFSGPNASLSAQTSLRSLSCDSRIPSLSSSCPRRPQVDFCSARVKTYASPRSDAGGSTNKRSTGKRRQVVGRPFIFTG
jgi:hypothetical protein